MRACVGAMAVVLLTSGCWADFPESRFGKSPDASHDRRIVDAPAIPPDGPPGEIPAPDFGQSDRPTGLDLLRVDQLKADARFTCVANSFVGCTTNKQSIIKCNPAGDATVEVNCGMSKCDVALKRCNGCNPSFPPSCGGSAVLSCSVDGVLVSTPCPQGCVAGKCCTDVDNDSYSTCAGDCRDDDPLVHPGQTSFYPTASNGSFDYNCDNKAEQEYPSPVSCHFMGGNCTGAGWQGTVPACGSAGVFVKCVKQAGSCVPDSAVPGTIQGCR
jgi:hypothetical protein